MGHDEIQMTVELINFWFILNIITPIRYSFKWFLNPLKEICILTRWMAITSMILQFCSSKKIKYFLTFFYTNYTHILFNFFFFLIFSSGKQNENVHGIDRRNNNWPSEFHAHCYIIIIVKNHYYMYDENSTPPGDSRVLNNFCVGARIVFK